jgi:hypothetical protein
MGAARVGEEREDSLMECCVGLCGVILGRMLRLMRRRDEQAWY